MKVHWINLIAGVAFMLIVALITWVLRILIRRTARWATAMVIAYLVRRQAAKQADDLGDTSDEGVGAS